MADLRISELAALAGVNLAAGDFLPIADVSASETKKITVTDLVGNATTLIADATIPGAKILFSAGTIAGASIATGGISATQLANDAVTASKIADEATVDLVTTLPASGGFVGQLALDTDDLKVYCWDGSQWQPIKAAGSVNTVVGSSTGIVNISITSTGDTVTISTSLDNTSAAAQFLAGPTAGSGTVGYRTIAGDDIPVATTTTKGGVTINGQGLRLNGNQLEVNNDVTAEGTIYGAVRYNSKGLVTAGRAITSVDLPVATSGGIGAVLPGTGLAVDAGGVINHTNTITPGTFTKITVDAQGHVSSSSLLLDTDIPNISASKLTSGTLNTALLGTNSISGAKLSNFSTVQFGGAGSTSGVVTFPSPEFTGQMFFDANNGDLYIYDGNTWQPITVISGDLVYAGTYTAATNKVASITTRGAAIGLIVGNSLPAASTTNVNYYVVVSQSGTGASPAPAVALAPPDMLISNGASWDLVDVSNAIAGQIASNISVTPYGNIAATDAQTAIQELDDEKLSKAGGIVTGQLLIGTAGSFAFEGSTDDAYETYLTVVNPTADRTITLPDVSGTVITTGDTGIVTSTMIANGTVVDADINASAAIADTKLATISTAGKVSNSATTATSGNTVSTIVARDASGNFSAGTITATAFSGGGGSLTGLTAANLSGTISSGVLGNSAAFVGTTSIALNRASASQALTGILSVTLPGSTSGTVTLLPTAVAGTTTTITLPPTTGTVVTTGDTGTVTNTMLSGSIADSKLSTLSTAGKVSNSATTATNANTVSTIVARDASGNFSAGTITAALTGAASSNVLKTGDTMTGNLTLNAQSNLRLADADSSHYLAFRAPATVAANLTFTLPATDGTSDQVLATDGLGTLKWNQPAQGVSLGTVVALS